MPERQLSSTPPETEAHGCGRYAALPGLGIAQAFTSYNNPKGNADREWLMRTVKEELVWIQEWKSPVGFIEALEKWVKKFNREYFHSALRYQTTMAFEQQYEARHRTLLQTAS